MRKSILIGAILTILGALPGKALAGVEYVDIESYGSGGTLSHAIATALKEALIQVNGASIQAESVASEMMVSLETADESLFASSSASADVIQSATKGAVRSYELVSKENDGTLWSVTVIAKIAKYEASAQTKRLRMSVLPFRLGKDRYATFRDKVVRGLIDNLTQARKFAILDREYEAEQARELAVMSSEDAPIEEMAKLGQKLGTDYVIVGTVEKADSSTREIKVQAANRVVKINSAAAVVSYRIIDAPTGQVKFSDTWSGGGENTSLDGLAQKAHDEIARRITDAIFPVMVENYDGEYLFLGQGGSAFKPGQVYKLIRYGDAITDSYTGESLGRTEIEVGLVRVESVQSKITRASVVKTTVNLSNVFTVGEFIVRIHSNVRSGAAGAGGSAKAAFKEQKKQVDKAAKKTEDDW